MSAVDERGMQTFGTPPSPQGRAARASEPGGVARPRRPSSSVPAGVARNLRNEATPQEKRLWARLRLLRPQGLHFRRQVPIDAYVVDFACLRQKLIVEVDGGQHNADVHARRDETRDDRLRGLGFKVMRFWNFDVDRELDAVVETILSNVYLDPTPALTGRPSPEGEGEAPLAQNLRPATRTD